MIFIIKYIKIIALNNLHFITFNFDFVKRKFYKTIILKQNFYKNEIEIIIKYV